MDINFRYHKIKKKWIAEVWTQNITFENSGHSVVYSEQEYQEMNNWCMENFKYHARTAYHIFEFKDRSHLDWFILRWK